MAIALWLLPRDGVAGASAPQSNPIADAELKRAAEKAELCSAANVTGTGLRGEYFAHQLGQGVPLLVRTDATVDFDAAFEWPSQGASRRPESARWSGWVRPPITGRYRFHADQPAASVTVARQLLAGAGAPADASIEMAAGRFYPITIEMKRLGEMTGRLRLEWTAPHGARFLVPKALLYVPNENALATKS